MISLNILICGGDYLALQRIARTLAGDGIRLATSSRLIDDLCFSNLEWDFLLVDLDGLSSFLRSLLPAVSRNFPNLPIIGISSRTDTDPLSLAYGLDLDDCLFGVPHPEELIVRFPQVAAKYLSDTGPLSPSGD